MIPEIIHIDPASIPSTVGAIPIKPVEPGLFSPIEIKINLESLLSSPEDIQCYALVPIKENKHGD